jgi:hypothetical protein
MELAFSPALEQVEKKPHGSVFDSGVRKLIETYAVERSFV